MKQKTILFLLLLMSFKGIIAQEEGIQKKKQPAYISISEGVTLSNFRDFKTSPLVYSGVTSFFNLSFLKSDSRKESEIGISYRSGNYSNDFNKQSQVSEVYSLSSYYRKMYQLRYLSSLKWNTKLGGEFNITGNYRDNEGLMNYSLGLEVVPTLFFSIKTERDVSRSIKNNLNKKQSQPRKRKLAYQLNIGVINSHVRADLPTLFDSSLSNNEIDIIGSLKGELFSGFRANSSLDYTVFFKNKNAIQFSYLWDAYTTGNDKKQFEMGTHTLKFSLLFNTNNR